MINVKLNEIADVFMGMRTSRYNKEQKDDVKKQKIYGNPIKIEEVSENIQEKFYSKKEDIVIAAPSPHKCNIILNENEVGSIIPMKYIIIRLKDTQQYDAHYLYSLLNSDNFKNQLEKLTVGSTMPIIKTKDIGELKFNFPSIEKQKKHGQYIALLNEKIEIEKKILEKDEEIRTEIINRIAKENKGAENNE